MTPDELATVWNCLHDGTLEWVRRDGDDAVVAVSCQYLRERLDPQGDRFELRVSPATALRATLRRAWEPPDIALDHWGALAPLEASVLEAGARDGAVEVLLQTRTTDLVTLRLDACRATLTLDGAHALTPAALAACARGYWEAWSAQHRAT